MKAAALDEIFSGEKPKENDDDFWQKATFGVPLREPSGSELDAFEGEEKPVQKTREEVRKDGIDTTPMMTVAEIREKFSKGRSPIFPKQVFGVSVRSPESRNAQLVNTSEKATLPQDTETGPDSHLLHEEEMNPPPSSVSHNLDTETVLARSPTSDNITLEEFLNMADFHGCHDAIRRFSEPTKVEIVIKPEGPSSRKSGNAVVREMLLQFNREQRLLVMVRQGAIRYIRLNDVIKIDGSDKCLSFLNSDALPPETSVKKPLAMYFTTTQHPMIIMLDSQTEKEALFKLIIFLRQMLKTSNNFEICA